ncbi:MAG TPA: triose-phosphate isomerase, partial [Bacillota bacterium]
MPGEVPAAPRRPLVAGNWKMNLTHREGARLAAEAVAALPPGPVDVVLCPPFTALQAVGEALAAGDPDGRVGLGAQNLHWQERGAFTGEVSAGMLAALGCRWVIVG